MTDIWYCTREDVKRSLDLKETVTADFEVDRAISAASRMIEGPQSLNRRFYPEIATRYFEWPSEVPGSAWTLWLDSDELVSVTTITNGDGNAISASDYFLEPVNDGPPFDRVEVDLASSATWQPATGTWQRAITITGVYGYDAAQRAAGAAAEALDASETEVQVTNGAKIGIGDLLTIDSERMYVTDRAWLDSGDTIQANVDAQKNTVSVTVSDGTNFTAGERILIDDEELLITSVVGNSLKVVRDWNGSVLAAHTSGAAVYASRSLTVERGVLGTTAATHLISAAVTAHQYPALVRSLCAAEAMEIIYQERSGYARTVGTGDAAIEARGVSLQALRKAARAAYGRKGGVYA